MSTDFLPLAVSATTSRAVDPPAQADIDACLLKLLDSQASPSIKARNIARGVLGTISEVDANNLEEAGWGVIFARDLDPEIPRLLAPLIEWRQQQAGSTRNRFRIFSGDDAPHETESASAWLARHGAPMGPVNPARGVPYYLMIVASPKQISFEFQYGLDLFWAVGRLWFDSPDDFGAYAEQTVRFETEPLCPTRRELVVFAPTHEGDGATDMLFEHVVCPLRADPDLGPLGEKLGYLRTELLGPAATKKALKLLMNRAELPPAVLFTGGHGMEFDFGDDRQRASQGALVCADWIYRTEISDKHWFAAADLGEKPRLQGLIHFCFACYGAGTPELDDFARDGQNQKQIAEQPFLSMLPQRLLASGALAIVGHIARAWSQSFTSAQGVSQSEAIRDVLHQVLSGRRVGNAIDVFNSLWPSRRVELDGIRDRWLARDSQVSTLASRLLIGINDARNYIVLGDPAVRTRALESPPQGIGIASPS